jgi:hypothetical protein
MCCNLGFSRYCTAPCGSIVVSFDRSTEKNEKWTPPVGGRDPAGQYDPRYHGKKGPIHVALPWSSPDEFDRNFTRNAQIQQEFDEILDGNTGMPVGLGTFRLLLSIIMSFFL